MSDTPPSRPAEQIKPVVAGSSAEGVPKTPPSNVKIYDRPERKGLSPVLLLIALIVLVLLAFVIYRMWIR